MLSRLKFEISNLVNEMLNQIPDEIWESEDRTFIDPAMGGGQFVKEIERRLRAKGHSNENITNRVFGMEKNKLRVNYAINKHGLIGKYWVGDHESEIDMKFDVVVGNPPYNDEKSQSSYSKLWSRVVISSWDLLNEDGYLSMITPRTWTSSRISSRKSQSEIVFQLIKNNAIVINISESISKHFNVGSSFSYFVLKKGKSGDKIFLITDSQQECVLRKNLHFGGIEEKIKNKLLSNFSVFEKAPRSTPKGNMVFDRERISEDLIKKYPYRVQYCQGTVKWSDTKHHYQDNLKVIFPTHTTKNEPIFDLGVSAPSIRGATYLVNSIQEGNNFMGYVRSKIMKFLISSQRSHHGFLSVSTVSNIPKIDLTRTWTDEELYEYFDLTQEEIDYIERAI